MVPRPVYENNADQWKSAPKKALDYACMLGVDDFKTSSGWLTRFKAKHKKLLLECCAVSRHLPDAHRTATWTSTAVPKIVDYVISGI